MWMQAKSCGQSNGIRIIRQSLTPFMNLLADAVTEYLLMQWAEGIDSAQIFDSLSTLVPQDLYWELSGK
jgi:uroporphyrinogen-III decarboxylase